METFDLIEKYLINLKQDLKNVRLIDYSINGSLIKINYSFECSFSEERNYDSDNFIFVDLLDYITFVFNRK